MYAVEDETFQRARSVISALARELDDQKDSDARRPADLHQLVRRSADVQLRPDGEAHYLRSIADDLARLFSIEELFPGKRRAGRG
jgi:hypothetical protein